MLREVILTVLAHRPMTGYEIARSFDQVLSHFWHASHQQIYRELARLDADGCVVFREVAGAGKPAKKLYSLTKNGRTQLQQWVAAPTGLPRPQYDLLVKLLAGLMVNQPALRREIARVQGETAAYLKLLRSMHESCLKQPLRTGYDFALYLALRRGLLLVEAQSAWLREVSRFLSRGALKRSRPR
ncbi:MAG: PadR family transcriptional regulator [Acidobacteriia bacterium]|nr:PadR family transcriptional regulator [Terriglobia bacterium]